jgi:hypothetical protein
VACALSAPDSVERVDITVETGVPTEPGDDFALFLTERYRSQSLGAVVGRQVEHRPWPPARRAWFACRKRFGALLVCSNITFTLSGGKLTRIEPGKRKKGGETAHTHPLHAVGTFFATDSSTVIGGIAVADNTEFVAGAVSDRIINDLTFLARQPINLPPFMQR